MQTNPRTKLKSIYQTAATTTLEDTLFLNNCFHCNWKTVWCH